VSATVCETKADLPGATSSTFATSSAEYIFEERLNLRAPTAIARRILKRPEFMHYNRLIVGVVLANLAILAYGSTMGGWWLSNDSPLLAVSTVAQANLATAIIVRQQYVINAICWLATRAPTKWPLRIRWTLAKVYHLGGLHVGAALTGTLWYLAFVVLVTAQGEQGDRTVSTANIVVSYLLVMLFVVMVVFALPPLRARKHDIFEATHRFGGWIALALVWVNTTLLIIARRRDVPIAVALLMAPTVWLLLLTTISGVLPWLRLRRIPVTIERPSSHVALVAMDHGTTPFIGSVRPISRHPLLGWHAFANVPAPGQLPGTYRMIVSRAGDWTSSFIDNPPSHVWVRGIPTAAMANVRKLFTKVLYVATGSGIGPMLGHLLANEVPAHLLWVTRNPHRTYGTALVDEILSALPDATIWNTDELGKPDMVKLAYTLYIACQAEAVICVANKTVTWQVVHGLERIGIPAFGPIWDS
jgi:hypothetical protein